MTLDESQLAEALHRLAPEPPREVTVEDIAVRLREQNSARPVRRPGRRRWWVPALVAGGVAVVTLATLTVTSLVGTDRHQTPPLGTTTPVTSPSSPTTPPTNGQPPRGRPVGPWHAVLIRQEDLLQAALISDGTWLYGRIGSSIVRLDPTTGAITASAPYPSLEVGPWLISGHVLWIAAGSATGNSVRVDRFRLPTLTRMGSISVPFPGMRTGGLGFSAPPDGSTLYLGAGREVAVLDPSTGGVERRIPVSGGEISSLAISPDEKLLYVAAGNGFVSQLQQLDAPSGRLLQVVPAGQLRANIGDLVATSGGVFMTSGSGMLDSVGFLSAGNLAHGIDEGVGGGGDSTSVTVAGTTVWVGGFHLTCSDPGTGRVRASITTRSQEGGATALNGIAFASGHAYAVFDGSASHGLARLTPPAACRP